MSQLNLSRLLVSLFLIPMTVATPGCGGKEATPQSIKEARARWDKAGIKDYDLEWESTGPNQAHYHVSVRGGNVRTIEGIGIDGQRYSLKPPDTSFYSVDGLFNVVAEEIALLETDTPFGQPKGTKAVLRFTTDPTYSYLKTYRRDVEGMPRALAIDVIRFQPVESGTSKK